MAVLVLFMFIMLLKGVPSRLRFLLFSMLVVNELVGVVLAKEVQGLALVMLLLELVAQLVGEVAPSGIFLMLTMLVGEF